MKNAFIIKGPVPPQCFFDRLEEVRYFKRLMELGVYDPLIAIVAPFKFGKSSLLLKLKSIAEEYNKTIPILVRLNVISNPVEFILKEFISKVSVGNEVRGRLLSLYNKRDLYLIFREMNDILLRDDKWLILFIDEFQDIPEAIKSEGFLTRRSDKFVFEFFRGLTEEFRLGLVVAGSILGPLIDAIDIWHGRFKIFKLRTFPREDSIKMLLELFKISGILINENIAEYIATAVADHPFHMQLFGFNLVNVGKVNENSLEEVRKTVQKDLIDYYSAKLIEILKMGEDLLKLLGRAIDGLPINQLSNAELEIAINLERAGVFYREDDQFFIYDPMFKRFLINTLSGRDNEKYLPEFTAEYLVASRLAHREGFRDILISYMSWGPFDIVILRRYDNYNGIGIQVKRTYKDAFSLSKEEVEKIIESSSEMKLIPVLAIIKMPEKEVKYYLLPDMKYSSASLNDIIKYILTSKQS